MVKCPGLDMLLRTRKRPSSWLYFISICFTCNTREPSFNKSQIPLQRLVNHDHNKSSTSPNRRECSQHTRISPNSTWLVTSRLDTTRYIRRVDPVELVVTSVSNRAVRQARHSQNAWARHVERVVSCRDLTWWAKWNLDYPSKQLEVECNRRHGTTTHASCLRKVEVTECGL